MKRTLFSLASLLCLSLPAHADRFTVPKHSAFEEECGSCHLAYPPQMLSAASWRAVMDGLPRHFGTDASLEEKRRAAIADFLQANAGGRKTGATLDTAGQPLLRISDTGWFRREHRKIAAATWQHPQVKSVANCAGCHTLAAEGDYRERNIRMPK